MGKKRDRAEPMMASVPAGTPASPAERGFAQCPCPKTKCELRADCVTCTAYHALKRSKIRCER